jgi:ABC-2 type transport system permease protein
MLVAQTRAVLTFYLRSPGFLLPSLALPLMLYGFVRAVFGNHLLPGAGGTPPLVMASVGAFAVSSILVFNVGIGQAQRRAQKHDLLQRATPLPPSLAIAADALAALMLSLVAIAVLFAVAAVTGGVRLAPFTWLELAGLLLAGSLPMMGLGLAIGYSAGSSAASALANLIYLPMAFVSGLMIPLGDLPSLARSVGRLMPTYHYAQLAAYGPLGGAEEPALTSVIWLAAWGVVLFTIAGRAYQRDQRQKFA